MTDDIRAEIHEKLESLNLGGHRPEGGSALQVTFTAEWDSPGDATPDLPVAGAERMRAPHPGAAP